MFRGRGIMVSPGREEDDYSKIFPHPQQTLKSFIPVSALRRCDWKKTASGCPHDGHGLRARGS